MLIWILFSLHLKAEYRVYQLALVDQQGETKKTVLSTLGPMQYSGYFHIPKNLSVVMMDSWMCFGNTSKFQAYCPNPKLAGRLPSSEEETLPPEEE